MSSFTVVVPANQQFIVDNRTSSSQPLEALSIELTKGSTSHPTLHKVTPQPNPDKEMVMFVDPKAQTATSFLSENFSKLNVTSTTQASFEQVWTDSIALLDNVIKDHKVRRLLISKLTGYFLHCFEHQVGLVGKPLFSVASKAIGNAILDALRQTTIHEASKPLINMLMTSCKLDESVTKIYLFDCFESILIKNEVHTSAAILEQLPTLQALLSNASGLVKKIPVAIKVLPTELQIDLLAPHADVIFSKFLSEGLCTVSARRCDMAEVIIDALLSENEKDLLSIKMNKFKCQYEMEIGAKDENGKLLQWECPGQMDFFLNFMSQIVILKHRNDACEYPANAMVLQLFLQESDSENSSTVAKDTSIRTQLIDICQKSIRDIPVEQLGSFIFALLNIATFDLFGETSNK